LRATDPGYEERLDLSPEVNSGRGHRGNASATGAPACDVLENQTGGYLLPREWAPMRDGWHLFDAEQGLL
jgi:hypothetical protein